MQELAGGFDGGDAGGTKIEVAAVVEDDVGGLAAALVAGDALGDASGYGGSVDGLPVAGDDVPLHGDKAQFAGGAEDVGAAGSVGRAEIMDGGSEGVFEAFVAGG